MEAADLQRVRVTYRKAGVLRFIGHLDLMRTWERALRRARLPLAYSQGYSPHPRIALAAPLPVGMIGERELMDVLLTEHLPASEVMEKLASTLPEDIDVLDVREVARKLPSLQASTLSARYRVVFDAADIDATALRERVESLLVRDELDWEEERGGKLRRYDLRAVVRALAVHEREGSVEVAMDLVLTPELTGRPGSVLRALAVDAEPLELIREELVVDTPQLAMQAWRTRGRHEE